MTVQIDLCHYTRTSKLPDELQGGLVLPDTLVLSFTSPEYELSELLVTMRNGKDKKQSKTFTGALHVPAILLREGMLEIEAALIVRGQAVKRWAIEPILIKQIEGDLTAFDAIHQMQADIAELMRRTQVTL